MIRVVDLQVNLDIVDLVGLQGQFCIDLQVDLFPCEWCVCSAVVDLGVGERRLVSFI